jgi:hypothetical protein
MDFEKNGHGKSWKSHGILNGRRCTNPVQSKLLSSLFTNLEIFLKKYMSGSVGVFFSNVLK